MTPTWLQIFSASRREKEDSLSALDGSAKRIVNGRPFSFTKVVHSYLQEANLCQVWQQLTKEYLPSSKNSEYSKWFPLRCHSPLDFQSVKFERSERLYQKKDHIKRNLNTLIDCMGKYPMRNSDILEFVRTRDFAFPNNPVIYWCVW